MSDNDDYYPEELPEPSHEFVNTFRARFIGKILDVAVLKEYCKPYEVFLCNRYRFNCEDYITDTIRICVENGIVVDFQYN